MACISLHILQLFSLHSCANGFMMATQSLLLHSLHQGGFSSMKLCQQLVVTSVLGRQPGSQLGAQEHDQEHTFPF